MMENTGRNGLDKRGVRFEEDQQRLELLLRSVVDTISKQNAEMMNNTREFLTNILDLFEQRLSGDIKRLLTRQERLEEFLAVSLNASLDDTKSWLRVANEQIPLKILNDVLQKAARAGVTAVFALLAFMIATHWASVKELLK